MVRKDMQHWLVYLVLSASFLFLAACVPQYSFYRAKCAWMKDCNFINCVQVCEQRLMACNKTCHNNCRHCGVYAQKKAIRDYHRYENQQYIQGGMLALDLNSFRDPLQCRKTTCDCRADYKVCTQACSGVIHIRGATHAL